MRIIFILTSGKEKVNCPAGEVASIWFALFSSQVAWVWNAAGLERFGSAQIEVAKSTGKKYWQKVLAKVLAK